MSFLEYSGRLRCIFTAMTDKSCTKDSRPIDHIEINPFGYDSMGPNRILHRYGEAPSQRPSELFLRDLRITFSQNSKGRPTIQLMQAAPRNPPSSDESLPRRKFTPDEDVRLRTLVGSLGTKNWEEIARFIPERSARQCRDRYKNYLVESLMADPWTAEEDAVVIQQFHRIGPKWVEIGKMLNGRSGNNVKNRWHKHLCRLDASLSRAASAVMEGPSPTAVIPPECVTDPVPPPLGPTDFAGPSLFPGFESAFSIDRTWNGAFSMRFTPLTTARAHASCHKARCASLSTPGSSIRDEGKSRPISL
jgi:hypothetical protein